MSYQVKQGKKVRRGKGILSLSTTPFLTLLGPLNHPVVKARWNGKTWVAEKPEDLRIEPLWQITPSEIPGIINGEAIPSSCTYQSRSPDRISCEGGWTITMQGIRPVETIVASNRDRETTILITILEIKEVP